MKFTVSSKIMKAAIDKAMSAVNKKATAAYLTRMYFRVGEDGTLKILATDLSQYVEIRESRIENACSGEVGIDTDDLNVLTKMSGEITLADERKDGTLVVNVKSGKKIVTIPAYENKGCDNEPLTLPVMDAAKTVNVLDVKESWLVETLKDLSPFLNNGSLFDDSNMIEKVFNFNTNQNRIEALDGHRIGMRSLENQKVYARITDRSETVKLPNICAKVFGKVFDKKSDNDVNICQDEHFVKVSGTNFTYITRRYDIRYFDVERMLNEETTFSFSVNRENILSVMQYNLGLLDSASKGRGVTVILHPTDGEVYSYVGTTKYQAFDELDTDNYKGNDEFCIGFNVQFLVDAFSVIDSDEPVVTGSKMIAPIVVKGDEYSFMILPVNIKEDYDKLLKTFKNYISKKEVVA